MRVRTDRRRNWEIRVSSSDIATHWDVSQKTAKRDISDLKQKELIEFLGALKKGYYRLKS